MEVTEKIDERNVNGWAKVEMHARYQVIMVRHPRQGWYGARSCGGLRSLPVPFDTLSDGARFCIELKYLDGAVDRAEGVATGEPIHFTIMPTVGRHPGFPDATISGPAKDGGAQIELDRFPGIDTPEPDDSWCVAPAVELKLSYVDLRNLARFDRQWTFPPFYDDPNREDCQGIVVFAIRMRCESKGLSLFQVMMPVFTHARCINCHGVVNPLTGAHHEGGKTDAGPQEAGRNITTLGGNESCVTCHDAAVQIGDNKVTPWRLAPANMSFVGKDAKALCKQVREFGFPDPELGDQFFRRHVAEDDLIGLAFEGRSGGAAKDSRPPPMSRGQFVERALKWAGDGNHSCGCFESLGKP